MNQVATFLQKLNGSQKLLYLSSQAELSEHAEDITFRAYDLLFSRYPELKCLLSKDRFSHPDLACLLSNDKQNIAQGVRTLEILIELPVTDPRIRKSQLLQQVQKCLIQSVRDIMYIEASQELIGIYSTLLNHRLSQTHLVSFD